MTNTELIRQEIDRLQEAQLDKCRNFSSGYNEGIFAGLSMLERFIDSLQQEQPEVDLEKEAEGYWVDAEWSKVMTLGKFKHIARHFANWQREQFHDACHQCEKAYDNVFFRGEQHAIKMLKEEAIEGKCIDVWMAGVVIDTDYGCLFLPKNTFEIGDKVKVIILKDGNED